MTTRTRIAITLGSALALGVTHYGSALNIANFGPEGETWHWRVLAAYALAIVAVALVDRWWALLPAAVPAAVSVYLYNLTDYSTPWDSESIGYPSEPVSYVILVLVGIALHAAVFSVGFLPRRVWHLGQRLNRSTRTR